MKCQRQETPNVGRQNDAVVILFINKARKAYVNLSNKLENLRILWDRRILYETFEILPRPTGNYLNECAIEGSVLG